MGAIKKVIFLFILLLLAAMAALKQRPANLAAPVSGVFETTPFPTFTVSSFMSTEFQQQFAHYIEDLRGMKGFFTRVRNQVDFTLFSIPHASKIVCGKKGYLFGEENINAYFGKNFAGRYYFDVKVVELKKFQDELWRRKGILLLVIFTPDKASFYHELIPKRYMRGMEMTNNYFCYSEKCATAGVNVIDVNNWFFLAKDTSRYPLFAKTGIHWSSYGALLAADSMARYISARLEIDLPRIVIDKISLSTMPKDDDDDISRTMNLFCRIPQPELAYPEFRYSSDSATVRPPALFIGDSYFWTWYRHGITRNIFKKTEFWYYDKEVYPETFVKPEYTWNISLKEAIERQKVIILMQTNNWKDYDFGHGFVDRTWPEYDTSADNRIRKIETYLCKGEENMKMFREKAKELQIPLQYEIRREAIFAGNNLLLKKK